MVTGLYALLLGVQPKQVHAWYLAVYVDAVEWVELPNTLGMSQYADGGLMGSKPYVATGKYIQRMSPHCSGCRYHPAQRVGDLGRLPGRVGFVAPVLQGAAAAGAEVRARRRDAVGAGVDDVGRGGPALAAADEGRGLHEFAGQRVG